MLNENLILSDNEISIDEFDIESIPFFKDFSIKSIKEYNSEKSIKTKKNKNKVVFQSTGSAKIFSSLKDKVITENKENTNLNKESKINFKVVLHHKRGRKKLEKNLFNQKYHYSDDYDNILRKIQVSFITFLIRLSNDALKTVFGKETKYLFKDINYKHKKDIKHDYIEYLKTISLGDILQMDISPKSKILKQDSNKITYLKVCKESEELKKLFDINYLYLFQKYYLNFINDGKHIMDIDGLKITLSSKTETFFNLLKKMRKIKPSLGRLLKMFSFRKMNKLRTNF